MKQFSEKCKPQILVRLEISLVFTSTNFSHFSISLASSGKPWIDIVLDGSFNSLLYCLQPDTSHVSGISIYDFKNSINFPSNCEVKTNAQRQRWNSNYNIQLKIYLSSIFIQFILSYFSVPCKFHVSILEHITLACHLINLCDFNTTRFIKVQEFSSLFRWLKELMTKISFALGSWLRNAWLTWLNNWKLMWNKKRT